MLAKILALSIEQRKLVVLGTLVLLFNCYGKRKAFQILHQTSYIHIKYFYILHLIKL